MYNQNTAFHSRVLTIIKESWKLIRGLKWPIFLIVFLTPIIYAVSVFTVTFILLPHNFLLSIPLFITLSCFSFLLLLFLSSLATMMGVRQAINLPLDIKAAYKQSMKVKDKLLGLFIIWLSITAIYAFLKFFFIPSGSLGLILSVLFFAICLYIKLPLIIFAAPLLITKRYELTTALEEAYKAMSKHWPLIFVCNFLMMILLFLSSLPLGIGLIWTGPMYFAMTGIFFRDIFGLLNKDQSNVVQAI